ncbi:lysophospholipid acyltransferase family protein [Ectobacillus ponti]|uniref:Lysophospholipid acyltransferase family protein n=1 Tax=Ectobacillus ponti TaxID=2961894 RepID=A0AA42BPC0_9BACI|nr:lysophospholipid acyltransferase family protein [Ectobacillus ponti]MCP8968261.1 lysophospholipid acyltransferase family protein [Ectobacillus ponti]
MIPAAPSRLFQFCFHQYNRRLFARSFAGIWVHRDSLAAPPPSALFILNHSSWWDGLVCFHLNRLLFGHSSYYMMHETGLRQYPLFRRLGAFSVNRDNPKDVLQSLQYSVKRLQEGGSIWMFPQGDEMHLELRPLGFLPGFLYLAEKATNIPVIPIALYYSFLHQQRPELFVKIGQPLSLPAGSSRAERAKLAEEAFTAGLDDVRRAVVAENMEAFIPLQDWKWES